MHAENLRSATLDNAKGLLIALVVFGHLLESLISEYPISRTIYIAVYLFHIPAFALISGVVSTRHTGWSEWWQGNRNLIAVFFVFEAAYELLHFAATGAPSKYILSAQPYWLLWYLWSLAIWRFVLTYVRGSAVTIVAAVVAGCLIGCLSHDFLYLGIARTFIFFPFFLAGYISRNYVKRFQPSTPRMVTAAVVLVAAIPLAFLNVTGHVEWLYGTHSYGALGATCLSGIFVRAVLYIVSFSISFALLFMMPRMATFFSSMSLNSLYVFVWHGFIVMTVEAAGVAQKVAAQSEGVFVLVALCFALMVSKILSGDVLANFTKAYLVDPFLLRVGGSKRS